MDVPAPIFKISTDDDYQRARRYFARLDAETRDPVDEAIRRGLFAALTQWEMEQEDARIAPGPELDT